MQIEGIAHTYPQLLWIVFGVWLFSMKRIVRGIYESRRNQVNNL